MSLDDRENFRKADISSTPDELARHKLDAAVEAIAVPFKPPFHRSKNIGDPLGSWADAIRRLIDRGLTGIRVKIAWFIFDKFDRNKGQFCYSLEAITKALGIDRSTAIRGLEYFERHGFLICLERHRGGDKPNLWTLSLPFEQGGGAYAPPPEMSTEVASTCHLKVGLRGGKSGRGRWQTEAGEVANQANGGGAYAPPNPYILSNPSILSANGDTSSGVLARDAERRSHAGGAAKIKPTIKRMPQGGPERNLHGDQELQVEIAKALGEHGWEILIALPNERWQLLRDSYRKHGPASDELIKLKAEAIFSSSPQESNTGSLQ